MLEELGVPGFDHLSPFVEDFVDLCSRFEVGDDLLVKAAEKLIVGLLLGMRVDDEGSDHVGFVLLVFSAVAEHNCI